MIHMNNIDHLDIGNNNDNNNNEVNEDNEVHIFNENTSRSCSTKSIFSSRTYSELISRDANNNNNIDNNKMITNFTAIDIDWYGNTSLHHAYALSKIDLKIIKNLLDLHPEYAKSKNQFGRLPLHYALDRTTVNIKGIELLLQYYPAAVSSKDNKNTTPYDIVLKWKHSSSIKRLLLDIEPDLDKITYLILKYGPIAKIYYCFYKPSYTCKYGDVDYDNYHRGDDNHDVDVHGNGHDKNNKLNSVVNWNKNRSNSGKILAASKDQYDNIDDDNGGDTNNHDSRNGNNSRSSSNNHTNNDNVIEIYDDDDDDNHNDNDHHDNIVLDGNNDPSENYGKHNHHHHHHHHHYDVTEVIAFNDDNHHIE